VSRMNKSEARKIAGQVLMHTDKNAGETNTHLWKIFRRLYRYGGLHNYTKLFEIKKHTWYKYKAAFQYGAATQIRSLLREADKMEKKDKSLSQTYREKAFRLAAEIQALQPDYQKKHRVQEKKYHYDRPRPYKMDKIEGKRKGLRSLPRDWVEKIIQALPVQHRDVAVVMALTGCRPSELQKGVVLEPESHGSLKITISGAKFKKGFQGQEQRVLVIDEVHTLTLFMKTLEKPTWIKLENKETFRKAFRRAAQKLGYKNVSPYSLRHQFSAGMKAEMNYRWTREDLAKALGHITDRCQQNYGHPNQNRGGSGILSAEASSPIKSNRGEIPAPHSDNRPR